MGIPELEPDFTDGMSRDELAHGLHLATAEIKKYKAVAEAAWPFKNYISMAECYSIEERDAFSEAQTKLCAVFAELDKDR